MRTLPAPSVPMASGPRPAVTADDAPPDEPPGVCAVFHGLRLMPVSSELVSPLQPNSGVAVLPNSTAPASRKRAVTGASTSQCCCGLTVRLPRSVGQPLVSIKSLIEAGTPCNAPTAAPLCLCACQRCSLTRALANAASSSTRQKAFNSGLSRAMRCNTCCVACTGEAWPLL